MKGFCHLSQIPLRAEPKSSSEMVSQLLYGESYQVLETHGEWYRIQMEYDGYEGWLSNSSIHLHEPAQATNVQTSLIEQWHSEKGILMTSMGSELENEIDNGTVTVAELAKSFLGVPYLWGGRHFAGIDCSGFVQIVYKCLGIRLPRDASQQQKVGKALKFSDLFEGDLVFFEKDEKVSHVGIALLNDKIIHAHGQVRIDELHDKGIFNQESQSYSHVYHSAKRIR